ncbi:MAG: alanine--tRNA ligase [Candidatus Krumholzibacteriota bacterium]|nr:alanine--tRNA ligase [Candidatus Krumholzibacteriota bacterium]
MNQKIRTAQQIRRAYIDFFVARGHTEVPSAPLVPAGDQTLLFTSAGMVPFKEYYLRPDNLPYTRAASVQKCLRAGDLESVGKTLRHHTFFEMLGNFSFGDYFKQEAIVWAWEFVTEVLQLSPERLYVSVFHEDDEAYRIWQGEIGLPAEKIFRLGKKDNFWGPVGKTGVCGPCSEIYYDTGEGKGCGKSDCAPGCDCDRYLEFWNLVFPQFFLEDGGHYRPLEKPGIDTGAGLERIAMIMQGVEDNFQTDLFEPIVEAVIGKLPSGGERDQEAVMGVNMIADHIRALTFTIAENIYPSNEGRGYLLRRILRRALTRLHTFGITEPFMYKLVEVVIGLMKDAYPELGGRQEEIEKIIRAEEKSFFRTLKEGRERFQSLVREIRKEGGGEINGDQVFLLYDTFGFPFELTVALAGEEGLQVDGEGFERAMQRQRLRAKRGSTFDSTGEEIIDMKEVSQGTASEFSGYEELDSRAQIRSFRPVDKSTRKDISWESPAGIAYEVIFERTPFYATAGGQVTDGGWIDIGKVRCEVREVIKRGADVVHLVEPEIENFELEKSLPENKMATLRVDKAKRLAIAANHSATHLLHAALREIIGGHIAQAGSLVDANRLRFDFNHYQAVSLEERQLIEEKVNGWIRDAIEIRTAIMGYKEAVRAGAIALFDEKYGEQVRVVKIGDISTELCGGTHLDNTGKIGLFLIVAESSVAAGIRRIEAVTGAAALAHLHQIQVRLEEAGSLLKVSSSEVAGRIRSLLSDIDDMKKEISKLERGEAVNELDALIQAGRDLGGMKVVYGRISVKDVGALRNQADLFRDRVKSGVALLSIPCNGKMQYVVTVTQDVVEKGLTANGLVRELSKVVGGGGGGKKHIAQLGTKDMESEGKVFEALPGIVERLISG